MGGPAESEFGVSFSIARTHLRDLAFHGYFARLSVGGWMFFLLGRREMASVFSTDPFPLKFPFLHR